MPVEIIAAALIRANRFSLHGEPYEDFDLTTYEGVEELAAKAVAISRAIKRQELAHELGSLSIEPATD